MFVVLLNCHSRGGGNLLICCESISEISHASGEFFAVLFPNYNLFSEMAGVVIIIYKTY